MPLTAKQEKFCQEYIKTGDKSEAYRLAYNTENMKPESVNRKAFETYNKVNIRSRIEELQEKGEKRNEITFDGQMQKLELIQGLAIEKERYNDAISAVKEQNKMLGYYEKDNTQKATTVNIPPIEWVEPQK